MHHRGAFYVVVDDDAGRRIKRSMMTERYFGAKDNFIVCFARTDPFIDIFARQSEALFVSLCGRHCV